MHRLWQATFGLQSARHLTIDADTAQAREGKPGHAVNALARSAEADDQSTPAQDRKVMSDAASPTG